jgi:hypothetical protein
MTERSALDYVAYNNSKPCVPPDPRWTSRNRREWPTFSGGVFFLFFTLRLFFEKQVSRSAHAVLQIVLRGPRLPRRILQIETSLYGFNLTAIWSCPGRKFGLREFRTRSFANQIVRYIQGNRMRPQCAHRNCAD